MTFTTRPAIEADYSTFLRLFPELQVEDPVPTLDAFRDRMVSRTLVLERANEPAGYAYYLVYGTTLHVGHVVVDPAYRKVGGGVELLDGLRQRAREEGCSRWYLNVMQGNVAALRLYEKCGFTIEHDSWAVRCGWDVLSAFPKQEAVARELLPEDDEIFELRFRVDRGRLASLRARPGTILAGLWAPHPSGFVAFDAAFPGMHPLRFTHPEIAGPLFEFLRPTAAQPTVNVIVEGDALLKDALVARGGELRGAFHRMSGEVG